jgi:hypothetical protein
VPLSRPLPSTQAPFVQKGGRILFYTILSLYLYVYLSKPWFLRVLTLVVNK